MHSITVISCRPFPAAVAVLSDADILKRLKRGSLAIRDFRQTNLTPNGYDLTIQEVEVPSVAERVTEGAATIPAQARFLVSTRERVEFGNDLVGTLWLRTTWARKGVLASFGKVDAGFRGTLTLAAFNAAREPLDLPIGETFAQLVFECLESEAARTYGERSGNYQDQEGVVR